jgi:hypothetical protein
MTDTPTQPKIGDEMPDGTVYAGVSTITGDRLLISVLGRKSLAPSMGLTEAKEAIRNLAEHGHHYRLPTRNELCALFKSVSEPFALSAAWRDESKNDLDPARKAILVPTAPPKP